MPPHLSGCGCSDLPRNVSLSAKMVSSPVLVLPKRAVDADAGRRDRAPGPASSRASPTCFWPIITWTRLDQSANSLDSCLSSSLVVLRVVELAGPIADIEPVDLAADAPADDAPGRLHRGTLVFRQIGGQGEDRLDRLMPVKALAPRIEAELLDIAQFLQSAAFDGIVHGGFRLSLSWESVHQFENMDCSRGENPVNCEWRRLGLTQSRKDAERKNVRITRIDVREVRQQRSSPRYYLCVFLRLCVKP